MRALLRRFKREADKFGYSLAGQNGKGHYVFEKNGHKITTSSTPRNEHQAVRCFRSNLRKTDA